MEQIILTIDFVENPTLDGDMTHKVAINRTLQTDFMGLS